MNNNREKIKADQPDIAFTEIAKVASVQWKELSAEDKLEWRVAKLVEKEAVFRPWLRFGACVWSLTPA